MYLSIALVVLWQTGALSGQFSRDAKPRLSLLSVQKAWEFRLKYAQGLVDEWISCQRTWLYLEPIFSSEDIMRQLPTEARRFNSVDQLWKKVRLRVLGSKRSFPSRVLRLLTDQARMRRGSCPSRGGRSWRRCCLCNNIFVFRPKRSEHIRAN